MTKVRLSIDPVTRLEGHLKVEVEVEGGVVVEARLTGGMYRGFETILCGRDPRDASQIVQRICGVCPVAHATAASLALEAASSTAIPPNGRRARNLMLAGNYVQSNILHFYHLAGQDYFRCPDTVPFTPRYEHPDLRLTKEQNALAVDEYLEALEVRQTCHELVALFGGRMPHLQGILAGGAAAIPTRDVILEFAVRLKKIRAFVENRYLPLAYRISAQYADLFAMAHGYRNALCAGVFPLGDGKEFFGAGLYLNGKDQPFDKNKIHEDVRYAWFASDNEKQPDVDKAGAYSFIKAPTYAGQRVEVGPLARMWVNDLPLSSMGRTALAAQFGITAQSFRELGEDRAFSIMGRNIARAEEVYALIGAIEGWLRDLEPGAPTFVLPDVPEEGEGFACTEAPRGALVHALRIKKHKIAAYTVIAASMWNCSPRDASGQRGAIEEALLGVAVPDVGSPVNVGRVIRAFDP